MAISEGFDGPQRISIFSLITGYSLHEVNTWNKYNWITRKIGLPWQTPTPPCIAEKKSQTPEEEPFTPRGGPLGPPILHCSRFLAHRHPTKHRRTKFWGDRALELKKPQLQPCPQNDRGGHYWRSSSWLGGIMGGTRIQHNTKIQKYSENKT